MTKIDYQTEVQSIDGKSGTLEPYEGDVLLIVNTASECGLTPQFEGLEALWESYKDQGLAVLGFPCNQFGGQDPGTNEEIDEFAKTKFGVTFPMHARIDVNGKDTHPLFETLKKAAPGVLGTKTIKWNFTKFLVGRDGEIVKRFGPKETPESTQSAIEAQLSSARP